MFIRVNRKPTGIPRCTVSVVAAEHEDGKREVQAFVSSLDSYDIASVACSLRMSPDEARDLARRMVETADRLQPRVDIVGQSGMNEPSLAKKKP